MVRLQVLVNGQMVCTAGLDEEGSLHARVHALRVERRWASVLKSPFSPPGAEIAEACDLEVAAEPSAGYKYPEERPKDRPVYDHLGWVEMALKPGDEVTIRVLSAGESDPPATRRLLEYF